MKTGTSLKPPLPISLRKFVPSKVIKPNTDVPWLNRSIKQKMKLRNKLYVHAKRTQAGSDWSTYKHIKNEVNNLMKETYHNYCTHLFDGAHSNNRKRFWSLIKHRRKDFSTITSLKVDRQCVTSPLDKAEALNNQFFTFFTDENTASPNLEPCFPLIGNLSFTMESLEDSLCLQTDLNTILDWTRKWQMQLKIDKCVVLRCTRSLFPITLDYKSDDITLKVVKQYELFFMKACDGCITFNLHVIKQINP